MIKGKKILITGGAGFIGSHLVNRLIPENKVTVIDNFRTGNEKNIKPFLRNPNFSFKKIDIFSEDIDEVMNDIDIVFHLSANSSVKLINNNIDFEQNIIVTKRLLDSMIRNGVKKIIFTSSSTVYGVPDKIPSKENDISLKPISLYGASKLSSEALISAYCHIFNIEGLVFRLANVIGPGCHGIIPDLMNKLYKNKDKLEILGDGTQSKSYIYIDDCIDAILLATEISDNQYEVFNLGSKDAVSVSNIVNIIVKETNLNPELIYSKKKEGWKGDVTKMLLDINKIMNIGWEPKFNSFEAIRKTIRSEIEKTAS